MVQQNSSSSLVLSVTWTSFHSYHDDTAAAAVTPRRVYTLRAAGWCLNCRLLSCHAVVVWIKDLRSFEIRFEPAVPIRFESHGPIRKFSNRPCLPIARRSQTTQTINGSLVVQYTDSLALWVMIRQYCLMCLRIGMINLYFHTSLLIRFVIDSNANGRFAGP